MKSQYKLVIVTLGLLALSVLLYYSPEIFIISLPHLGWRQDLIMILFWIGPTVIFLLAFIFNIITAIQLIRKEKWKGLVYAGIVTILLIVFFSIAKFRAMPVLGNSAIQDSVTLSSDVQLLLNDTYRSQDTIEVKAINVSSSTYQYTATAWGKSDCDLEVFDNQRRKVEISDFYCGDVLDFGSIVPNQTLTLIKFKLNRCVRSISDFGTACLEERRLASGKYTLRAEFYDAGSTGNKIVVEKNFTIQN